MWNKSQYFLMLCDTNLNISQCYVKQISIFLNAMWHKSQYFSMLCETNLNISQCYVKQISIFLNVMWNKSQYFLMLCEINLNISQCYVLSERWAHNYNTLFNSKDAHFEHCLLVPCIFSPLFVVKVVSLTNLVLYLPLFPRPQTLRRLV